MQNSEEASPSIILAGGALLVKMLISMEPRGAFDSNFVYFCILTLSSHWFSKHRQGFTGHYFGQSSFLVKMLITLGPHGIFSSYFACLYSLTLIF